MNGNLDDAYQHTHTKIQVTVHSYLSKSDFSTTELKKKKQIIFKGQLPKISFSKQNTSFFEDNNF